jgi:[1-hydroxy-2-(trimethylamino)ethyl]phosphonate dioxygenase
MHIGSIDTLFRTMQERGRRSYGLTGLTQLEHGLQAAQLAELKGLDPTLTIAALFHDIGHLSYRRDIALADDGIDNRHEASGALILARLFGTKVSEPVRLHVAAKRFLCAIDANYADRLSPDSQRSLALQGGAFTPAEAEEFYALPQAPRAILLHQIDDEAKVPGAATATLERYRLLAESVAHGLLQAAS